MNPNELVERYIASWNETDTERRRALIAGIWTEQASYVDPMTKSEGHDGIDAMIATVQARFPGLRFRQLGKVDAHNDRIRFAWELAPDGAAAVASGTDFGVLADGRLEAIAGFLDRVPTTL